MKIQCDVCSGAAAATVFCCADEAALCDGCDRKVHHANKLAGKHRRFSLIEYSSSSPPSSPSRPPSGKADPLCDVCKERRGFVFCQEDRAILCRDCDDPIHSANDLTMKHSRFLLTGVRLSAAPITSSSSSSSSSLESNSRSPGDEKVATNINSKKNSVNAKQDKILGTEGSSISEYLIKVCPGWHVEDLLVDDDDAAVGGFSKEKELPAFHGAGADLDGVGGLDSTATELPKWVPLVPQLPPLPPEIPTIPNCSTSSAVAFSSPWMGAKELSLSYGVGWRVGQERWSDDAVTVPQISPAPSNKRARAPVWYY